MKALSRQWARSASLLLLFSGLACTIAISDRVPLHLDRRLSRPMLHEEFDHYYAAMVDVSFPGPYAYRLLVPLTVAGIQRLYPLDSITVDFALKVLLLIACQWFFFIYLRKLLTATSALAGVLLLDVLVGYCLAYVPGPSVGETAGILDMLIFILALLALLEDRFVLLCAILFAGMFNRETPLLLLPAIVLAELQKPRSRTRIAAAAAALAVPYLGLRLFLPVPAGGSWFTLESIGKNIPFITSTPVSVAATSNAHLLMLLGPLAGIGLFRFRLHPLFLKTAAAVAPLYLIVHYIVGAIIESRLWLPLLVIIVPLTVDTLASLLSEQQPEAA